MATDPTPADPTSADPSPVESSPVDKLSYEDARAELVETVHKLEAGGATLEESLALWERGEQLAQACQRLLDGARKRLDAVTEAAAD